MRMGMAVTWSGVLASTLAACNNGGEIVDGTDAGEGTESVSGTSSGGPDDSTEGVDESSTGEPDPEIPWDGDWPTLECDSIVPEYCAFPFPNNVFTVPEAGTVTGRRVELSESMVPTATNGTMTALDIFNTRDGFSPGIGLMAFLPGAVIDGLPRPDDIAASLAANSPTVLLDVETGEHVPHWAELDMTTDDDTRRAFTIRPAVRLEDDRRYIVAIRRVIDANGQPVPPSPAFAALRDRTDSEDPSVESRRGLYTDIFAQLTAAGVERDDLQLAWDFSTASRDDNTGWLVGMRDEAFEATGPDGPAYTLDAVTTDWSADIAVRILGHMEVPLYLDQPGVGGVINLDDDGRPAQNGTAQYPFEVLVPYSAMTEPAALVQFGHGLFGTYESVESLGALANTHNLVIFAFDWIGMSEPDALPIAGLLSSGDLSGFQTLPSRLMQSQVNALLGMRMMSGAFVDDPAVQVAGGGSAIDPEQRYFFGASLGGIMGSVYMALTPDVERGALGVSGQSFNLLVFRSELFDPFFDILRLTYDDPRDIQMIMSTAMLLWDRAEPTGFSKYIRSGELSMPHEVLMQVALGDHLVTNYGSHLMARTIGVPLLTPSPQGVWGLEEVESGHVGSGLIEHDFGLPPIPLDNVPMREGSDPHGAIWSYGAGIDELEHFLRTGEITSFCDGVCDPE